MAGSDDHNDHTHPEDAELAADDGAASDELIESVYIWSSRTNAPAIDISSAPPTTTSPFSDTSTLSSVVQLSSSPDSDFDIVDRPNSPGFTQADGRAEQGRGWREYAENLIPQAQKTIKQSARTGKRKLTKALERPALVGTSRMEAETSDDYHHDPDWQQAGPDADQQDLAGPGAHGKLECTVGSPRKEGEGTQNAYVSYLVTTKTDFKSFQSSYGEVRRRFTDFVFLYKTLSKEYPQCAVPPLPDKHNMSYVRGDRYSPDFTMRRAFSLGRFLKRLALHPVLRRATLLTLFLESTDWNATMKSRPTRGMSGSDVANSSALETWTDSFLNAFTKPHKSDKRFLEVKERADKLDSDLGTVSKTVARVARRESDLESDYADLGTQFQKLATLEPSVHDELTKFAASAQETSEGWKGLKEHTDRDYLGSLKDMESYITSVKSLLKTREQKQLDFEALTEYLNKAAYERDTLASHGNMGASGFLRQKIEDVRGVDHEQSRRERQRKLEVQISRLTDEVEGAKKTTEAFDEEVVKEIADFERIKAVEFRDTLGSLAEANIAFFKNDIDIWQRFVQDMEKQQAEAAAASK